ncbi:hypothetical protein I4U23_026842 [Adineta vaga]|nr:hypothetical protein I4U23_026842 [Adineta vaga]
MFSKVTVAVILLVAMFAIMCEAYRGRDYDEFRSFRGRDRRFYDRGPYGRRFSGFNTYGGAGFGGFGLGATYALGAVAAVPLVTTAVVATPVLTTALVSQPLLFG